jgi:hypothetical protein
LKQHHNNALGDTLHQAIQHQRDVAETLREQANTEQHMPDHVDDTQEPTVTLLTKEAEALLQSMPTDMTALGPVKVAKYLAEEALLNRDQQGPVALIAKDMQTAWEQQGKPKKMKDEGKILRMLLLGGGGCGKTRIINLVLTALFITFWGARGCVKIAPSNKAARGILGKTLHAAAKLVVSSLKTMNLRCSTQVQTALAYLWAPCGALIMDEALQGSASLYHALSLRCTYGRAPAHELEVADYAAPSQTFGAIPIVVECGDELQLPPVPATAGLFAPQQNAATEHMAGVQIFGQKDYVYRLSTMKRFTDDTQISILTKMRRQGGCKLSRQEWQALQCTDISGLSATEQQERLRGTELWYQAAPTWATVTMAQTIRSRQSAEKAGATLFVIPALDFVLNRTDFSMNDEQLAEEIARVPNMNTTGRLPAVALVHIGMEMRLTNTVEAPEAVTDAMCKVMGLDLHSEDACSVSSSDAVRVLRNMPHAIIVRLDNVVTEFLPPLPCTRHLAAGARRKCCNCDFRAGCIAIEPQTSPRPFSVEIGDRHLNVKRRQVPLTIKTASTLHTLQGVTASPGLIFHWRFARRTDKELRWLATYVALSRPESLAQLISIGLPADMRSTIEAGPPDGILTMFSGMFHEIEEATHLRAAEVLRELGW